MCGIAGYITADTVLAAHAEAALNAMTNAILHRGPDSAGMWHDEAGHVGLGMRRLAIVDVSSAGAQPMTSASGRYVLVFNGEIYNHKELRARLESDGYAPNWRGHSDTEVLLAAIDTWGLTPALQAANGMFGLALWDRDQRMLSLACDRFGEKPLYYGRSGRTFLFGSELKSLAAHPDWAGEIDRDVLALFTQFSYVPAPYSIYRNIRKLEPGTIVSIAAARTDGAAETNVTHYWSAHEMIEGARRNPLTNGEVKKEFERVFSSAVALRMEADVPLGAFLSGGFDSTAVVAMMQELSSRPVRTFSIGFNETGYDEAPFANRVAQHLQTEHTQLYVTAKQAMDVIPKLPTLYDEPFADSSQIPTFLVAELARRHVTVALSGDGGDELFGGYVRYIVADRIGRAASVAPSWLRNGIADAIRKVGAGRWDRMYDAVTHGRAKRLIGDRAVKFADFLASNTPLQGYERMVTAWPPAANVVLGAKNGHTLPQPPAGLNPVEAMMFCDLVTYLPGDILTKVDRATMGVSLEGRVPFLDHRLAEFAWRLPLKEKIAGGQGKRVVKDFVYSRVPRALMDRPKAGFGAPIGDWLRGPLRDWAESLLSEKRIASEGFFDANTVTACWQRHLAGRGNEDIRLWPILMFQAWLAGTKH
ncbi:MAG: asparagine synthase (glutamine-hydrolyzing) [Alphaproteobacteria bacterium]|nr:asparagine synthase (glutamine-hydrolyzing) [Alphaproteobacteria bacterium]